MRIFIFFIALHLCLFSALSMAQYNSGQGAAKDLYLEHCASCHGQDLSGGLGSALNDAQWQFGSTDEAIARNIAEGITAAGMPAWQASLDETQIRSLVILLREEAKIAATAQSEQEQSLPARFSSQHHDFMLEEIATTEGLLWGIDFLPDGSILATERMGRLWLKREGEQPSQILNTPTVLAEWQGGLLDVKVHPKYKKNGWIYLSFSEKSEQGAMTAIVRGRIRDGKWVDEQSIFRVPPELHVGTGHHYGSRIEILNGYIYFSVGERGQREHAQDLAQPGGKIHRLHEDGRIPSDNPFVKTEGAYPSIWSLGHRNPQGMDIHPRRSEIWTSEHGPRGGDEINIIKAGENYGWPLITHGMNYDGTAISNDQEKAGYTSPIHYWTPSISPGGIQFYEGDQFPHWRSSLFIGGMGAKEVHRLELKGTEVLTDEVIYSGPGRVRDIAVDDKGFVYLLLNTREPESGKIIRMSPIAKKGK